MLSLQKITLEKIKSYSIIIRGQNNENTVGFFFIIIIIILFSYFYSPNLDIKLCRLNVAIDLCVG